MSEFINIYKKIIFLLPNQNKIIPFILLIMMVVTVFLEIFSIGIIIPIASSLIEGDLNEYSFFNKINFNINYSSNFLIFIFLFIYLFKIFFSLIFSWFQFSYIANIYSNLMRTLFAKYLSQDYNFFLKRDSPEIIRNLTGQATEFAEFCINGSLVLLTELFVLFGIISFLIYIDPINTSVVIFILSISVYIFQKVTSKKIEYLGYMRQIQDKLILKNLMQGIGSFKELKVLSRHKFFQKRFDERVIHKSQIVKKIQIYGAIPRLWLETIIITILMLFLIFLIFSSKEFKYYIPYFIIYAAATVRVIPSFSRIIRSLQMLKYGMSMLENLNKEMQLKLYNHKSKKMSEFKKFERIEFKNVSFSYNKKFINLKNINFSIQKGDYVGLVGKSGSGKSTLIDLFLGLQVPNSGSIKINSFNIDKILSQWHLKIGYVSQNIFILDDTIINNIAYGIEESEIDISKIKNLIEILELSELVENSTHGLDSIIGERGKKISGGQIQRIGIARALYSNPEILILDESTSSLDSQTESSIIDSLKNISSKITILMISHKSSTLKNCKHIMKLENGVLKTIK